MANDNKLTDEEAAKMLIGQWHCDSSKEANCGFSKSTYIKDGTLEYLGYKTAECNSIIDQIEATWEIKNQVLIITVTGGSSATESEGPEDLIVLPQKLLIGTVIKDEVVSITDTELVLMYDDVEHYRKKGDVCQQ